MMCGELHWFCLLHRCHDIEAMSHRPDISLTAERISLHYTLLLPLDASMQSILSQQRCCQGETSTQASLHVLVQSLPPAESVPQAIKRIC